ncbi:MAG: hypothetical protein CMH56_07740 [Myxococcales bacterium]|nr:hypothetical protein [Myxococcales bacterium]
MVAGAGYMVGAREMSAGRPRGKLMYEELLPGKIRLRNHGRFIDSNPNFGLSGCISLIKRLLSNLGNGKIPSDKGK